MTSPNPAITGATALISSYCGRDPQSGQFQACAHDHTGEGEAFVRLVERMRLPELLRELLTGGPDDQLADRVRAKVAELDEQASVVPAR